MSHRVNKSYTGVTELLDSKKTLKDQTREYILNWIKERNLRPGDRLPPQRELSQILNVSPKIPELVLNELEAEHLVVRRCGRGTFLAGSPETAPRVSAGTRNVFLLLPTLRNPHFAEYAANAEVALHRGKRTMHIITGEAMPQTRDVIAQMVREGTGGIIALHCPDGLRAFAHRNRIPMVEIRYQSSASRRPAAGCFVIADLRAAAQNSETIFLRSDTGIFIWREICPRQEDSVTAVLNFSQKCWKNTAAVSVTCLRSIRSHIIRAMKRSERNWHRQCWRKDFLPRLQSSSTASAP